MLGIFINGFLKRVIVKIYVESHNETLNYDTLTWIFLYIGIAQTMEKQEDNFKHKTPVQIRFVDTDMLGHVNNSIYLSFMEYARINYFRAVLGANVNWNSRGIIVAKAVIDYKIPIFFRDNLVVKTRVSRLGKKSFDMEYQLIHITPEKKEVLKATGVTVMVCYNYEENKTIEIPAEWREKIAKLEGLD